MQPAHYGPAGSRRVVGQKELTCRAGCAVYCSGRAIWLSTRNDAMLNVLTVVAAVFVVIARSVWPDVIAGAIIATVNLFGSVEVISAVTGEMRKTDST